MRFNFFRKNILFVWKIQKKSRKWHTQKLKLILKKLKKRIFILSFLWSFSAPEFFDALEKIYTGRSLLTGRRSSHQQTTSWFLYLEAVLSLFHYMSKFRAALRATVLFVLGVTFFRNSASFLEFSEISSWNFWNFSIFFRRTSKIISKINLNSLFYSFQMESCKIWHELCKKSTERNQCYDQAPSSFNCLVALPNDFLMFKPLASMVSDTERKYLQLKRNTGSKPTSLYSNYFSKY